MSENDCSEFNEPLPGCFGWSFCIEICAGYKDFDQDPDYDNEPLDEREIVWFFRAPKRTTIERYERCPDGTRPALGSAGGFNRNLCYAPGASADEGVPKEYINDKSEEINKRTIGSQRCFDYTAESCASGGRFPGTPPNGLGFELEQETSFEQFDNPDTRRDESEPKETENETYELSLNGGRRTVSTTRCSTTFSTSTTLYREQDFSSGTIRRFSSPDGLSVYLGEKRYIDELINGDDFWEYFSEGNLSDWFINIFNLDSENTTSNNSRTVINEYQHRALRDSKTSNCDNGGSPPGWLPEYEKDRDEDRETLRKVEICFPTDRDLIAVKRVANGATLEIYSKNYATGEVDQLLGTISTGAGADEHVCLIKKIFTSRSCGNLVIRTEKQRYNCALVAFTISNIFKEPLSGLTRIVPLSKLVYLFPGRRVSTVSYTPISSGEQGFFQETLWRRLGNYTQLIDQNGEPFFPEVNEGLGYFVGQGGFYDNINRNDWFYRADAPVQRYVLEWRNDCTITDQDINGVVTNPDEFVIEDEEGKPIGLYTEVIVSGGISLRDFDPSDSWEQGIIEDFRYYTFNEIIDRIEYDSPVPIPGTFNQTEQTIRVYNEANSVLLTETLIQGSSDRVVYISETVEFQVISCPTLDREDEELVSCCDELRALLNLVIGAQSDLNARVVNIENTLNSVQLPTTAWETYQCGLGDPQFGTANSYPASEQGLQNVVNNLSLLISGLGYSFGHLKSVVCDAHEIPNSGGARLRDAARDTNLKVTAINDEIVGIVTDEQAWSVTKCRGQGANLDANLPAAQGLAQTLQVLIGSQKLLGDSIEKVNGNVCAENNPGQPPGQTEVDLQPVIDEVQLNRQILQVLDITTNNTQTLVETVSTKADSIKEDTITVKGILDRPTGVPVSVISGCNEEGRPWDDFEAEELWIESFLSNQKAALVNSGFSLTEANDYIDAVRNETTELLIDFLQFFNLSIPTQQIDAFTEPNRLDGIIAILGNMSGLLQSLEFVSKMYFCGNPRFPPQVSFTVRQSTTPLLIQPYEEYTEIPTSSKISIYFIESGKPFSEGDSIWHLAVRSPINAENIDYCSMLLPLSHQKGNVLVRSYYLNSKNWIGGYFISEEEGRRVVNQLRTLTTETTEEPRVSFTSKNIQQVSLATYNAYVYLYSPTLSDDPNAPPKAPNDRKPTEVICIKPPPEGCI